MDVLVDWFLQSTNSSELTFQSNEEQRCHSTIRKYKNKFTTRHPLTIRVPIVKYQWLEGSMLVKGKEESKK